MTELNQITSGQINEYLIKHILTFKRDKTAILLKFFKQVNQVKQRKDFKELEPIAKQMHLFNLSDDESKIVLDFFEDIEVYYYGKGKKC